MSKLASSMPNDFLSDEDKALFRRVVEKVKPLPKNKKIVSVEAKSPPQATKSPNYSPQSTMTKDHDFYLSDYYTEVVQANTLLSYCSHSIPAKRLRELKSGQISWQARLDLHGLRSDDAKNALIQFIRQQHALAHRCLLIIHGKGSLQGEPPVLKNLVNHWLQQFPQVLAFHSALSRDGGSGALYVLLKRQRE